MDEAVKWTLWILDALAVVAWVAALATVVYRLYQLFAYETIEAEVLKAETDAYMRVSAGEDAHGFRRDTWHRVYRAEALVRYQYQAREYTAVARHEKETGSWRRANRLVEKCRPGTRVRLRIHPEKPDQPRWGLGLNLATFQAAFVLAVMGFGFLGLGYGLKRVVALFTSRMGGSGGPGFAP